MPALEYGYVYFLDAPSVNRIKIGTGIAPEDRLQAVRLMSPVPIELIGLIIGGRSREAELHKKFAEYRAHGEWFEGADYVREQISLLLLEDAWNAAGPEAREEFLLRIDAPVVDRGAAA